VMEAETCTDCGAVPLAGEAVSQALSLEFVKVRVPDPELAILKLAGAGLLPPATAWKESTCGEKESTGEVTGKENAPTVPPPLKVVQEPA